MSSLILPVSVVNKFFPLLQRVFLNGIVMRCGQLQEIVSTSNSQNAIRLGKICADEKLFFPNALNISLVTLLRVGRKGQDGPVIL